MKLLGGGTLITDDDSTVDLLLFLWVFHLIFFLVHLHSYPSSLTGAYVCLCMCVYVCVCVRERKKKRKGRTSSLLLFWKGGGSCFCSSFQLQILQVILALTEVHHLCLENSCFFVSRFQVQRSLAARWGELVGDRETDKADNNRNKKRREVCGQAGVIGLFFSFFSWVGKGRISVFYLLLPGTREGTGVVWFCFFVEEEEEEEGKKKEPQEELVMWVARFKTSKGGDASRECCRLLIMRREEQEEAPSS